MKFSYKSDEFVFARFLGQGDFGSVALYEVEAGTKQCIVKTIKDNAKLPLVKRNKKTGVAKKALVREYETYKELGRAVALRENGSQLVIEDPTLGTVLNQL